MTKLEFEATITDAKPVMAKDGNYGNSSSGELRLTLALKQPPKPREPFRDYILEQPRPEALKRKAKEADEEYEQRNAGRDRDQIRWDAAKAKYEADVARFQQEAQGYQARLMSYASLVGLAAVFGNKPLTVTLVPIEQGLLPDYGISLLAEPPALEGAVEVAAEGVEAPDPVCPSCGHPRGFHDDEPPAGCADINDAGVPCECELGETGW